MVNANINHPTKTYTDITNNPSTLLPAQTILNGGISVIPVDGHWTVTLSGQHLANKRHALGQGFTPQTTPSTSGTAIDRTTPCNDPRTVALPMKYALSASPMRHPPAPCEAAMAIVASDPSRPRATRAWSQDGGPP